MSFANKPSDGKQLTDIEIRANYEAMPTMLLCMFRFVRLLWSGHQSIAIENAALRLQLRALQRTRKRPMLTTSDRLFWSVLARLPPRDRAMRPFSSSAVIAKPILGGLHHEYRWGKAA